MRCLVLACVACGRVGFGAIDDAGNANSDGGDAQMISCAPVAVVPDLITITGRTFRYNAFDNTNSIPLGNAAVTAFDPTTAAMLGNTMSNASGDYAINFSTGGAPTAVALSYSLAGYFQSMLWFNFPLDRDYDGAFVPIWSVGDGPLWNMSQMTMIYSTAGLARNTAASTVNVAVRDCAHQPLVGATVAVTPPPERLMYQASSGTFGTDPTTVAPFAHAVAFNAVDTVTTFDASAPGYTFAALTFVVTPGPFNHLVVLRADPP